MTDVYIYWYEYGLYILVCPALLPSSLSWRFLNFVFFFRWALKASPKASYQEKQTESKLSTNMQKYLWWLFNIYCLILLFVIVMLIIMMPYKKLMRSWFCCWLLWAFRTRLISWNDKKWLMMTLIIMSIPDICHGRHGHTRVNFFWPV